MITYADVSIAADGAALLMIPRVGLEPDRKVCVAFPDGDLVVAQGGKEYVRVSKPRSKASIQRAPEVTVLEVGTDGDLTLHPAVEVNVSDSGEES